MLSKLAMNTVDFVPGDPIEYTDEWSEQSYTVPKYIVTLNDKEVGHLYEEDSQPSWGEPHKGKWIFSPTDQYYWHIEEGEDEIKKRNLSMLNQLSWNDSTEAQEDVMVYLTSDTVVKQV